MIFLFDAVVLLVFLEMEQIFCENMICIMLYIMLHSMQALTEKQCRRGLRLLPHCAQNSLLVVLLGVRRLEQSSIKHLVCIQKGRH